MITSSPEDIAAEFLEKPLEFASALVQFRSIAEKSVADYERLVSLMRELQKQNEDLRGMLLERDIQISSLNEMAAYYKFNTVH